VSVRASDEVAQGRSVVKQTTCARHVTRCLLHGARCQNLVTARRVQALPIDPNPLRDHNEGAGVGPSDPALRATASKKERCLQER
jgi:hypothetical protein